MCVRLCSSMFRCIRRIFFTTILVSIFIAFCPNFPPEGTFVSYQDKLKPYIQLQPNTILNEAERILDGQLIGPEAFVAHKGVLYTGLHGGHVVKVLPHKVEPFLKTGKPCEGIHQEQICGRPLGLRVQNDVMYIADAYYGIYSHNIANGPGKPVHLLGPNIEVNGKPCRLINSLEVDGDDIYFTSSSSEFDLTEGVYAMLATGTGRLIKFNQKTKKVTQLLDNLLLANGLALSGDGESILIAELGARRILKYHFNSGKVETLLDGLPGYPDNIQYAGDNTYWVSLVFPSDDALPGLTDVFADWPLVRRFLARAMVALEFPFKLINQYYPNQFCELAAYHIGHLGPVMALSPEKVTIIRFDGNSGEIVDYLQGDNGRVKIISDVAVFGGYMYLGSPHNNYIGRLALTGDLKNKYPQTEEAASGGSAKAKKFAQEEARKAAAAEEAKKAAAAEAAKKAAAAEAAKKAAAAEEAKKAAVAEAAKKAAAAEAAKKAAAAEEAKKAAAAEEAKKAAAAEAAKKAAAAEAAKKAAAAEEAKKVAAAEAAKKAAAAEQAKKAAKPADKPKVEEGNKKKPDRDAQANKVAEETGKAKVHGDKVKTEL